MKTLLKTDKKYANKLKYSRIKNSPTNFVCNSACSSVCSFHFQTKFANRKIQISGINVTQQHVLDRYDQHIMVLIRFWIKQGKVSHNVLFMKNYNFVRFYFGKVRCHLQSEVKRKYVMAPKMALKVAPKNKLLTSSTIPYLPKTRLGSLLITSKLPLVYICTYIHKSGH